MKEGFKKYEFSYVPNDWNIKKIGEIYKDLKAGATPSRSKPEFFEGDIPWISSGELKSKYIYNTNEKITREALESANLRIYPKGTFFIAITGLEAEGTRGSCGINKIEVATNQSCLAFRKIEEVNTEFLYYWYMLYGDFIGLKYTQGTKQQSLNNKIVEDLEFAYPSLKEQQKIVEILSIVDSQIDDTDKCIEKTKELKKGLMQRLLTKGIGHTEFKMTEIGEIPVEWEIRLLGDINNLIDGDRSSNYPSPNEIVDRGILFLSTSNIKDNKLVYDECKFITQEKFNSLRKGKLEKDDLIITLRGTIGSVAKFNGDEYNTGFINAQMLIIRGLEILPSYLWKYLISDISKKQIEIISSGSAQPQLTKKDLNNLKIAVPSRDEQEKTADILTSVDNQIEEYENKKTKLEELKNGLMQQLLTGKIRV